MSLHERAVIAAAFDNMRNSLPARGEPSDAQVKMLADNALVMVEQLVCDFNRLVDALERISGSPVT